MACARRVLQSRTHPSGSTQLEAAMRFVFGCLRLWRRGFPRQFALLPCFVWLKSVLFNLLCVFDLFQNASSHLCFLFFCVCVQKERFLHNPFTELVTERRFYHYGHSMPENYSSFEKHDITDNYLHGRFHLLDSLLQLLLFLNDKLTQLHRRQSVSVVKSHQVVPVSPFLSPSSWSRPSSPATAGVLWLLFHYSHRRLKFFFSRHSLRSR